MKRKCHCCDTYQMDYQIHDSEMGQVLLCRKCFMRMDGRLTEQKPTMDSYFMDRVYERHKDTIERVKAELAWEQQKELERMWEMDSSHVKEGMMSY